MVKVRDPKLRVAFYYGMGNMLVAQDLEQARRIGYNTSWNRLVTLNVSPTGTQPNLRQLTDLEYFAATAGKDV